MGTKGSNRNRSRIAIEVGGGLLLAIGWQTRCAALALAIFCIVTAVMFHLNFADRNQVLHFEKDLAIAGGMFVLMLRGAGDYSVGAFASRRISYDDGWQRLVRAFESTGNVRDEAMISKKQAD